MHKKVYHCLCFLIIPLTTLGQNTRINGPVIDNYGSVYKVNDIDFTTDSTAIFKVVFDIDRIFENKDLPNPLIETAARFLNLHVQNGMPIENLEVALVIHGAASNDILSNEKHKERFDKPNPNARLLEELDERGVQIILCGQTAAHRNISKEDALPQVKWALSAMTALIQLQNNEYRLIKF